MKQQTIFRLERLKDVAFLHVMGDVDVSNATEFEHALNEAANADDRPLVVVSMLETLYVDTTALGVLVAASRAYGDRMRIITPEESTVRRILTMTGLNRTLRLHEDFTSALSASDLHQAAT